MLNKVRVRLLFFAIFVYAPNALCCVNQNKTGFFLPPLFSSGAFFSDNAYVRGGVDRLIQLLNGNDSSVVCQKSLFFELLASCSPMVLMLCQHGIVHRFTQAHNVDAFELYEMRELCRLLVEKGCGFALFKIFSQLSFSCIRALLCDAFSNEDYAFHQVMLTVWPTKKVSAGGTKGKICPLRMGDVPGALEMLIRNESPLHFCHERQSADNPVPVRLARQKLVEMISKLLFHPGLRWYGYDVNGLLQGVACFSIKNDVATIHAIVSDSLAEDADKIDDPIKQKLLTHIVADVKKRKGVKIVAIMPMIPDIAAHQSYISNGFAISGCNSKTLRLLMTRKVI